jgi:hypothetical protein
MASSVREVALDLGLHPNLNLQEACSDFYALERVVADGFKEATRLQMDFERKLAEEINTYLVLACGGELRHAPKILRNRSCETWEGKGLDSNRPNHGMFPPELDEFFGTASSFGDREDGWERWWEVYQKYGEQASAWAVDIFNMPWGASYGGPSWAAIAKAQYAYKFNKDIKNGPRFFMNQAWTLQHNGGCVFNKLYSTSGLYQVLEAQKKKSYDNLVTQYSSPRMKRLWRAAKAFRHQAIMEEHDPAWYGAMIYGDELDLPSELPLPLIPEKERVVRDEDDDNSNSCGDPYCEECN